MARKQRKVQIEELNTKEGKRLHDLRKNLKEKGAKPSPKRTDGENPLRRFYAKYAPSFNLSSLNNKWVIGAAATVALSAVSLGTGAPAITLTHAALTTAISGAMVATAYVASKGVMAAWNYGASFFAKKEDTTKPKKGKKPAAEENTSTLDSVRSTVSNGLHTVSSGLHTAYDYTIGATIGAGTKFVGSLFHRHQEAQKPAGRGSRAFSGMDSKNIIDGPRTRNRAK